MKMREFEYGYTLIELKQMEIVVIDTGLELEKYLKAEYLSVLSSWQVIIIDNLWLYGVAPGLSLSPFYIPLSVHVNIEFPMYQQYKSCALHFQLFIKIKSSKGKSPLFCSAPL